MSDINYGPQAEAVHAIEARFDTLTKDEKQKLYDLRDEAFWMALAVVDDGRADRAGLGAARDALYDHLRGFYDDGTACGAALAVLLRHTITADEWVYYDALVRPWVTVTGMPAHPDDVVRSHPAGTLESELTTLATMVRLLEALDIEARHRVIRYLGNRYGVDL